jgi:hypothetical protein
MSSMLQGDALIGDPAEFHVVTKKQRKKKSGRSSSIGRNERSQNYAQSNIYHVCELPIFLAPLFSYLSLQSELCASRGKIIRGEVLQ